MTKQDFATAELNLKQIAFAANDIEKYTFSDMHSLIEVSSDNRIKTHIAFNTDIDTMNMGALFVSSLGIFVDKTKKVTRGYFHLYG